MDDIPTFNGEQNKLDCWPTCGQFIAMIEENAIKENLKDDQIKQLCKSKMSKKALELIHEYSNHSWTELRNMMFHLFSVKLTIREKVEIRKKLQQKESESIEDFYQRCVQAQYLVSDDIRDAAFEREVLLHFLIGLSPFIRDLVLTSKCSSTKDFISEAKRHFEIIKIEPIEVEVKIEPDQQQNNVKNLQKDGDYEMDESYQYDDFDDDSADSEDKPLNFKYGKWKCEKCSKTFPTKRRLNGHYKRVHIKTSDMKCDYCDQSFNR